MNTRQKVAQKTSTAKSVSTQNIKQKRQKVARECRAKGMQKHQHERPSKEKRKAAETLPHEI